MNTKHPKKINDKQTCWGCQRNFDNSQLLKYTQLQDTEFIETYWCATCESVVCDTDYWTRKNYVYGEVRLMQGWDKERMKIEGWI